MIPTPRCSLFPNGHSRRSWRVFSGSRMGWKLTRSSGQSHHSLLRILSRQIRKSRNTVNAPAVRTGPDPMDLLKRRFEGMLPNDSGCGSMVVGASTASDQHDSVKFSFLDCKLVCTLNSGGHLLGVWIWWTWLCWCYGCIIYPMALSSIILVIIFVYGLRQQLHGCIHRCMGLINYHFGLECSYFGIVLEFIRMDTPVVRLSELGLQINLGSYSTKAKHHTSN